MAFKIYTKTGDLGETSLFGGKRLPKNALRIEAYGTVDELNAYVGLLNDLITNSEIKNVLTTVQNRLFDIGSILAVDPEKEMAVPELHIKDIETLELQIDAMDKVLPALKNFILPGGHPIVSQCHICRVVCRRAERRVVGLHQEGPVDALTIQFLNRLSDYFFMLGRFMAQSLKVDEITWQPR